jgi:hypothetical protein
LPSLLRRETCKQTTSYKLAMHSLRLPSQEAPAMPQAHNPPACAPAAAQSSQTPCTFALSGPLPRRRLNIYRNQTSYDVVLQGFSARLPSQSIASGCAIESNASPRAAHILSGLAFTLAKFLLEKDRNCDAEIHSTPHLYRES